MAPTSPKPLAGDVRRELAVVHGLVERRQGLRAQERRREELVLGPDVDSFARQLEHHAAVDDESRHGLHAIALIAA